MVGASRHTFHGEGGTIGRENDNSWVLPHPRVSGHHAVITYRDASFYIEDTSRNGVCLNTARNRLERGRRYALKSGDRILIDPYEILVSITRDQNDMPEGDVGGLADVPSSDVPFDEPNPFDDDPFAPRPILSSGLQSPAEEIPGQQLDPIKLLNLARKPAPARKAPAASAIDLEGGSPLEDHYKPPAVMPAGVTDPQPSAITIPEGYNPLAPDESPPVPPSLSSPVPSKEQMARLSGEERVASALIAPEQLPRPPQHRESAGGGAPAATSPGPPRTDFAAVLAGAGLVPGSVSPEIACAFGQILRVVVSGVMDVMRSRQQIKDEFRMHMTRVRPMENNPLKFSTDVDDALHNLLVKRNPAYLGAVEAFEDAFADLRHHQLAMLAGMRVAFESMLAEFDPARLQEEFDRQKGLVPAKLRYWDLFREKCRDLASDPEATFRRLFGEEFARAYEDQITQLRAQERSAGKASSRSPEQRDT
jgi:type VI secretion system FHA domain protein